VSLDTAPQQRRRQNCHEICPKRHPLPLKLSRS